MVDINLSGSANPRNLINVNGTLFFCADDGSHGTELWRTAITTTLTITNGNNQSTTVSNSFGTPLVVQVLDQFGEPMEGVSATFTAPSNGASALFGGNSTITVTTDANGQASRECQYQYRGGQLHCHGNRGKSQRQLLIGERSGTLRPVGVQDSAAGEGECGPAFRLQVQLRDQFGNAVRLPNVAVRLRLLSGSGPGCWSSGRVLTAWRRLATWCCPSRDVTVW
ncbi:MAG: hypothetical protein WHU94_07670 [Thermogemmata sp.]|jgi:ELWxxDGT repeat protein